MHPFVPGQSAYAAHSALKTAVQTMDSAQQNAVLWFGEILSRKLYQDLGYSSINQYAQQALGFSRTRTGDFLHLCRKLDKLPAIKREVAEGKLGYTKARELAKVADQKNETEWLELAKSKSRRELEHEVKRAKLEAVNLAQGQTSLLPAPVNRPAAVIPVRVSFEFTPEQFARYEALTEQLHKRGGAGADRVEILLQALSSLVEESAPRGGIEGPPFQIHIHQCPDCEKATIQTSRGEMAISPQDLDRARCDAQTQEPGQRNTSTIPPAVRRQVLARDRHRCQSPGCPHTRFLEIHHKIPRAQGGSHDPENLITLCSACHARVHRHPASQVLAREKEARYQASLCMVPDFPCPSP
jgi:5-methylcytosine-specific restriction endonuclease McrA